MPWLYGQLPWGKKNPKKQQTNQKMHKSCMFDKCFQIQAGFCPGKLQIRFVITHLLCSHGKLLLMSEVGF